LSEGLVAMLPVLISLAIRSTLRQGSRTGANLSNWPLPNSPSVRRSRKTTWCIDAADG